jgi:hypothetical protein
MDFRRGTGVAGGVALHKLGTREVHTQIFDGILGQARQKTGLASWKLICRDQ